MKKLMLLCIGAAITVAASAQATPSKAAAEQAVKKDVKALKDDRKERNTKIAHGKFKQAQEKQTEIKSERKNLNANKKHLKNKGVKAPVQQAKEGTL